MGDAVLVDSVPLKRPGTLEEDDIVFTALEAIQSGDLAVDLQGVGVVRIATHAAEKLHPQHFGIELACPVDVIHRDSHVIDFLEFHLSALLAISPKNLMGLRSDLSSHCTRTCLVLEMTAD